MVGNPEHVTACRQEKRDQAMRRTGPLAKAPGRVFWLSYSLSHPKQLLCIAAQVFVKTMDFV
jgi:hypothetical protein